jgi:transposase
MKAAFETLDGTVGEWPMPKRWVVGRSASWLNRFRKLRIRWEKKAENYLGFIQLACCIVVYRRTILG